MNETTPGTLSGDALDQALGNCPGWTAVTPTAIARSFKFKTFIDAFGFMTQVALLAEKAGHHPDWSNSYNTVEIALSTHSKGGVTESDIALAQKINRLVES